MWNAETSSKYKKDKPEINQQINRPLVTLYMYLITTQLCNEMLSVSLQTETIC